MSELEIVEWISFFFKVGFGILLFLWIHNNARRFRRCPECEKRIWLEPNIIHHSVQGTFHFECYKENN